MSESLSKLTSFAVLGQTDVRASKLVSFAVLNSAVVSASKLVSFAVLFSSGASFTLTDSAASSDPFTVTAGDFAFTLSDTVMSTDALTVGGDIAETLSDSAVTSDTFDVLFGYNFTLNDIVVSSDLLTVVTAGSVSVTFSGLIREVLTTVGSATTVAFDSVIRSSLISAQSTATTQLVFDGLVREILALDVPNVGPIPVFGPVGIFPALPRGFPIKVTPTMDTIIGTTKSLREMRVAQRLVPLWDIEILFEGLKDQTQNQVAYAPFAGFEQYEEIVQTWLMMYGQTNVFAFDCPWDNSRLNQPIGIGDGTTHLFTIYRTWGVAPNATLAPIGVINQALDVSVNGVTVSPTLYYTSGNRLYFVSADGHFHPPVAGGVITMTMTFYYLCRFLEDEQDFEEFSKNRWTVPSLKFRAVSWVFG